MSYVGFSTIRKRGGVHLSNKQLQKLQLPSVDMNSVKWKLWLHTLTVFGDQYHSESWLNCNCKNIIDNCELFGWENINASMIKVKFTRFYYIVPNKIYSTK